ncbi:Succinate receptor 1 [Bagarius yarrelli]|uniref:Succinate receptor 1 n=1 Tax=Bagarius yarrelli TaxID=175774 RepID=A0A556UY59_BAGYA|nr:Succinate receptor 1 [Bagarius yarrelli]
MYGLEFTIGFIGNIVVVLGYVLCLPAWKSTNVYLFNLAISDLVFLCTLPKLSYSYNYNLKKFNPGLCVVNRYILHVNLYSSILFMMWDNCSTLITPLLEKYYLSPMYGLEFALGFLGNLVVVLGYIFCLPAWKSTNVYLFNLSLSDLVFFCTLPELSYNYTFNLRRFNSALCMINRYILNVNMYSSILFMMWVSVDRFLLLCHPQREHILLTLKASLFITLLNWIWVTAQIAPLIVFIIQDLNQNGWTVCRDFGSLGVPKIILSYSIVLTFTGYIVPLVALFLSSRKMVDVLRKREELRGKSFQRPVRIVRIATILFLQNCNLYVQDMIIKLELRRRCGKVDGGD